MATGCNKLFLLQILLFAQHVSGIVMPETCRANNKICNKNHLLHPVSILSHINDDAGQNHIKFILRINCDPRWLYLQETDLLQCS